jgi:hypothetical protein
MTAIQEAEQAGFDLSLIDESLRCSYEQRALQHQMALELALELETKGQQLRDRTQSTTAAPILNRSGALARYGRKKIGSLCRLRIPCAARMPSR